MVAHHMTNSEVRETLHDVIETLIDGQQGFQKLGEHIKDGTVKKYFLEESIKRAQFRGEIESALHQEGDHDPKETGSLSGAMHRSWGDLKAHMGGGDHTILETVEKGEDIAEETYQKAIKKDLPLHLRELLSKQFAHIQQSHDYVKSARDRTN
jgi:uncharacterized protein (TIGR02284 family)